jgi:hypothetical protein
MLTLAWYYPRNTVIPVVIPKKELFMPTGLLTMLRSYRHIRPHNEQRKRIGLYLWSKGQPLVLSWKSQSSNPTETIFARKRGGGGIRQRIFFFCFRYFFCPPTPHFFPSCASHKPPLPTKLWGRVDHIPPPPFAPFWCVLVDVIPLMPILCALNMLFYLAL